MVGSRSLVAGRLLPVAAAGLSEERDDLVGAMVWANERPERIFCGIRSDEFKAMSVPVEVIRKRTRNDDATFI